MSIQFRWVLLALMVSALFFGFLNLFLNEATPYNFNRLHIFLFNLCTGGTILLYFSEQRPAVSKKVMLFLLLTLIYAVLAFLNIYMPVLFITCMLCLIVEFIRIRRFSVFPIDFFKPEIPVSEKFHQAALLCLSMGLLISALVILNNQYLHLVDLPKLQLDTFFLGFSFPLSLITMSLIFSLMKDKGALVLVLKNLGFWNVNLGVIIFFLFIIFQELMPQVVVTTILFATVVMILYLFLALGKELQQKAFLISGIGFLLYTAITGILYIIFELMPGYSPDKLHWLLRLHAFASLYGWNLCGLSIICRYNDFPLKLHSKYVIALHWVTVILLAPLGSYFRFFAVCAAACYFILLYVIFFTKGKIQPAASR
jgi:hypothetical protein